MCSIGECHPDCLLEPETPLNVPTSAIACDQNDQLFVATQLIEHSNQEKQETERMKRRLNGIATTAASTDWKEESENPISPVLNWNGQMEVDTFTQSFVKVAPPKPQSSLPSFQRSRLLLSHLGFLTFAGLKDNCFQLLAKSPALFRDIKGLDKKLGREAIKVAVIYVKEGQEDEQSILRNQKGSVEYEAFVKSLGWEV